MDNAVKVFSGGQEKGNSFGDQPISAQYDDMLDECVACGKDEIYLWDTKRFQYTHGNSTEKFDIYRCVNCGTGFLNPPPSLLWLKSIYQFSGHALTQEITLTEVLEREAQFPNSTVDAERMAYYADYFNHTSNKTALDIGSGFGFYTQALRKRGYSTVSVNPGKYENSVFKQLNGDEPIPVMLEDFNNETQFGVVMMSQVLEHLREPNLAIQKVASLLAPGGVLACAVPNFESLAVRLLGTRDNACLWVPEHVNYFTSRGLKLLLESNGFKVVRTEQISRIPLYSWSRRMRVKGKLAALMNAILARLQTPFAWLTKLFGLGIYLNMYAVKA
jgi:SAM-dependent methyltransferase